MRSRSLRLPLAAALTALTMVAAGCGDSSSSGEGPKVAKPADSAEGVTLRVGVQKDGIRPLLKESGALEGLPYKIEYSVFAFGPPLVEAAGADKIDVAVVGSTPPIFGAAAKSNFRVLATNQFANQPGRLLPDQGRRHQGRRGPEGQEHRRGQGQLGPRAAAAHPQARRAEPGRREDLLPAAARRAVRVQARRHRRLVGVGAVRQPGTPGRRARHRRRPARRARHQLHDRLDQGGRGPQAGRRAQGLHRAAAPGLRVGQVATRTSSPRPGRRRRGCRRR